MKSIFVSTLLATVSLAAKGFYKRDIEVKVPEFPDADLDALYGSTGQYKRAQKAELGGIREAQETILTPVRSIDSLFLRVPSASQLDQLILSADSVGVLKTIQTVATDDSIPCDQRIAYLLEVLGRLRSAIQLKIFGVEQLKVIIDGAIQQIQRLEDQIYRLQDDKMALWLDEMRFKLKKLGKQLMEVYNKFNTIQSQIPPKEAEVTGYEKQIHILTKSSDGERNRMAQDKLKITQIQAIIRDLQQQLNSARQRKGVLQASVEKSKKVIDSNNVKISQARLQTRIIQKQIDQLQDKADSLRGKYTQLEIKVQRLRTDISVAEAKEDKINAEIDRFIDRINQQKKKIALDELDDLNHMVSKLKELVPITQKEMDRHYYYCYGQGSVKVQNTGGVIVYIVKGQRFGDYIHNAYGKQIMVKEIEDDVHLSRVNVFGDTWTNKFGYPFVDNSITGGRTFGKDFSCLNPTGAHSGYGKISNIESNIIYVDVHDGSTERLHIGTCSRIQCTKKIPQVGQNIIYSGVPSGNGGYNLYTATAY